MIEDFLEAETADNRVQRSIPLREDANLTKVVSFLDNEDFDPTKIRYESPLSLTPTEIDARKLSKFKKCEVYVLGIVEEEQTKIRVITGEKDNVNQQSLYPNLEWVASHIYGKYGEPASRETFTEKVKQTLASYPVLNEEGEFTERKWNFRIHNHPSGDNGPSLDDIITSVASEKDIIVAESGVTVIQPTGQLSKELVDALGLHGVSTAREIVCSSDLLDKAIAYTLEKALPESPNTEEMETYYKKIVLELAELLGIEVIFYKWEQTSEVNMLFSELRSN